MLEELHNHLYFWPPVGLLGNRGEPGYQSLSSGLPGGGKPGRYGLHKQTLPHPRTTEGCPEEVMGGGD